MKVRIGRAGLSTKLAILLLLIVVLLALFSMWGRLEAARAERDLAARRVQAQLDINAGLAEEIQRGDADENVARIAREKLGLVEPNEQVFVDANHQN